MKLEITQQLVDKIRNYCQVNVINLLNLTKSDKRVLHYADEATSEILLKFHRNNIEGKWKKQNFTDNYFFISCKNFVLNTINKEKALKRNMLMDYNNLRLDESFDDDMKYELIGFDPNEKSKVEQDKEIQEKLDFVVQVLEENEWINPFAIELFVWHFIENKYLKAFKEEKKCDYKKVTQSKKKIINVISFLWEGADINK